MRSALPIGRTSNPALTEHTFDVPRYHGHAMTVMGTVHKTGLCLLILSVTASYVWGQAFAGQPLGHWTMLGAIAGLIVALVTIFKKTWSPVTAPLYAAVEGLFLGGLSAGFEARYPGIVINAVGLTFGTLGALLLAYRSGLIPVTQNFKLGLAAATGGIGLVYLASMLLGFFGIQIPLIHESGLVGIGFSLLVTGIAAMNLVMDFDFIERGAETGAPKFMEWFAAFGLLVAFIWLYVEFLRLLAKLQGGRDRR